MTMNLCTHIYIYIFMFLYICNYMYMYIYIYIYMYIIWNHILPGVWNQSGCSIFRPGIGSVLLQPFPVYPSAESVRAAMATTAPLLGQQQKKGHSKASIFYGADEYLEEKNTTSNIWLVVWIYFLRILPFLLGITIPIGFLEWDETTNQTSSTYLNISFWSMS